MFVLGGKRMDDSLEYTGIKNLVLYSNLAGSVLSSTN